MSEELQEQTLPSGQQDAEFPIRQTLVGKMKGWRSGLGERWAQLHTNQIIYLVAFILFFVVEGDLQEPTTAIWVVGVLAFFGMARELWAIFIKVWESTFGRLILLVLYAAIANFTIAVASQKVNIVITADPTQLYHTLGVTTLLVLPLWLMVVSVVAMIVIFGLMQILRLIRGLFVLARIIPRNTKPKEAFPKTFIVVRLILLVPVSMTVLNSLAWYGEQLNLPRIPGYSVSDNSGGIVEEQVTKVGLNIIEIELQKDILSDQERKDLLIAKQKLLEKSDNIIEQNLAQRGPVENEDALSTEQDKAELEQENEESTEIYFLDKLIASFVYNYEAFEYSHCQKEPNERVVYISENDILVVKQDENAPTGFAFSTRSCIVAN
ncbi:MAG: hypothetical protein ACJAVV_000057 [Alphaproteobacteria bacterium]|jgi:hypothetical protein